MKINFKTAKLAAKVRRAVYSVSEVAEALNNVSGKFNLHNYLALSTLATGKLADALSYNPNSDVSSVEVNAVPHHVRNFLKVICSRYPTEKIRLGLDKPVDITTLPDGTVVMFQGGGWEVTIWVYKENPKEEDHEAEMRLVRSLGRVVWDVLGSSVAVAGTDRQEHISLQSSVLKDPLRSKQSDNVLARTQKLLANGNRSLLLYGPPGTGKTCMSQAIASEMRGFTMSITAKNLSDMNDNVLTFLLDMLSPNTLLVDDIDRVKDVSTILAAIDRIRPRTRLVIVTVNHLDRMDAAIKRAGRFDELIEVLQVVPPSHIIPDLPKDKAEKIDKWPIAFVTELKYRLDALGPECLQTEMDDLQSRVDKNILSTCK